jgi:hypothetical protein
MKIMWYKVFFLPVLLFLCSKTEISIAITDEKEEHVKNEDQKKIMHQVAIGAVIGVAFTTVIYFLSNLVNKIKKVFSAEGYYIAAENTYNQSYDSVVAYETPDFESLIEVTASHAKWNFLVSQDDYIASIYYKLLDCQKSLTNAFDYLKIAASKTCSDDIRIKINILHTDISMLFQLCRKKILLCEMHPLFKHHMKLYNKKKEQKLKQEHNNAMQASAYAQQQVNNRTVMMSDIVITNAL